MAWVCRWELKQHIKSVKWRGRAGAVHLKAVAADGEVLAHFYIIGVHGAHQEYHKQSLLDVAHLIRKRPRGATVMLTGDINVDYAVELEDDPFKDLPGREKRHEDKRRNLRAFLESQEMEVHRPIPSITGPNGSTDELVTQFPLSRVPGGEERGLPPYSITQSQRRVT